MKAATIALAVVAMLGLSALSQLGLALADDGFLPQAQPNFSGEMGSRVLTNSGGALQLGAACTTGVAGDACVGGTLNLDAAAGAVALQLKSQAYIQFVTGATTDARTAIRANGTGNLRVGEGVGQVGLAGHEFRGAYTTGGASLVSGTFANLNTPTGGNGTVKYCTDCTIGAPCTGSGTGALALRRNGAWDCL